MSFPEVKAPQKLIVWAIYFLSPILFHCFANWNDVLRGLIMDWLEIIVVSPLALKTNFANEIRSLEKVAGMLAK